MKLKCEACGKAIEAEDINIQENTALCRECGNVFGFGHLVGGATSAHHTGKNVPMPKNVTVVPQPDGTLFIMRWFTPAFLFLLLFCVFWDGFLVVWYFIAFTQDGELIMKLFPLLHVLVGIGLTYYTLAGLLNRTYVRVTAGEVTVRHAPLPGFGNRVIPRADLDQLFTEKRIHSGKHGISYTYNVHAILRDGARVRLLSGLTAPEQALFFEYQIEHLLGIRDRKVSGEMEN